MPCRAIAMPVLLGILVGLAACRREPPEPATRILPEAAAPGTTVVVQPEELGPETRAEAVRVLVGEQPAMVLDLAPEAGVGFLVPDHPPGEAEVRVEIDGQAVGSATLTVLAPPALHLVLKMTGDEIELLSERGAQGLARPSREIPEGRALAYDVLTEEGVLIATGVLSHPLEGRREVFEEDGTMHGVSALESATFTLRIPALPGGGTVRFYEAEAGVDPGTEEGRAARRPLSEIRIGGQGR